MKQDLSTMMDMVREMYEDGRKSTKLREQLNSMKEEKQLLSDKLQEWRGNFILQIWTWKGCMN